jgi:hypothetical protein
VQLFAELAASCQTSSNTQRKPVTLYGRIEELSTHSGAQLPALTRQGGRVDQSSPTTTRLPGKVTTYYGSSTTAPSYAPQSQSSFPESFLGYWQGTLRIHSNQFAPVAFQVDRDETLKEQELLAPGKEGSVSFTFGRTGNQLYLEPTQVVFSAPMSQSRHANELQALSLQMGPGFSGFIQNTPYYYGLEMGNVSGGVGVTGNSLHNQVVKNDIKQFGQGIVEQDLVSYNQENNPNSGRSQSGYSEIVLRFYPQGAQQFYVQVASVNYLADGRFKDKIFLYGTVQRTNTPAAPRQYQTLTPSIPSEMQDVFKQFPFGGSN